MKLYLANVSAISLKVIETLVNDGSIEVLPVGRQEAARDLSAIMEEFLRREREITRETKDMMSRIKLPYDEFGSQKSKLSKRKKHPSGGDIEKFLSRQFIESFMISNFVDEVYATDDYMYKKMLTILRDFHVDENEVREEAMSRITNISKGTVEYEIALQSAIREVKQKRGLIKN
tara:strand:- start:11181 stop:11705 length:525 start_codon:yes stop_codon:yes gene_type:complete